MDDKDSIPRRRNAIRAFRAEDFGRIAEARVATFELFGAGGDARALRAERRARGGQGYDLMRHIGLIRRRKRQRPAGEPEAGPRA